MRARPQLLRFTPPSQKTLPRPICRNVSEDFFAVLILEDFARDFPGRFFWDLPFPPPPKIRRKNLAKKSVKTHKKEKREKSVLPTKPTLQKQFGNSRLTTGKKDSFSSCFALKILRASAIELASSELSWRTKRNSTLLLLHEAQQPAFLPAHLKHSFGSVARMHAHTHTHTRSQRGHACRCSLWNIFHWEPKMQRKKMWRKKLCRTVFRNNPPKHCKTQENAPFCETVLTCFFLHICVVCFQLKIVFEIGGAKLWEVPVWNN